MLRLGMQRLELESPNVRRKANVSAEHYHTEVGEYSILSWK